MFTIKSKEEIDILREGGEILADIMEAVLDKVKPGVETGELEDLACEMMEKRGGRPAFKGYEIFQDGFFPTALCISINEEIVHGPAYPSRKIKEGDILSIDCGMEYPVAIERKAGELIYSIQKQERTSPINKYSLHGGYYTDMARTVAAGKIGKDTRKLMNTTRECLEKAIARIKPGNTLNDIGKAIQEHAESRNFSVVRELVGHRVGHDVHEDPKIFNYEISPYGFEDMALKPGMVVAIEPMVNMGQYKIKVAEDNFTIVTADNSLSAHFEDTIAITENGAEVITRK